MPAKKLLIIAHDFPPHGITSSRRPAGMVKYLSEFGWDTVVLTKKWTKENCNYDPEFIPNLPSKKIYEVEANLFSGFSVAGIHERIMKLARPGLHPYGFFKNGKKVIESMVKEEQFDAILATAPQGNVLDLANYASKLSGKPWVADFRDVWQWVPNLKTRFVLPLILNHEKRIVKNAAEIIAVSKGFAATLSRRHDREVKVVSHGFDEELIPQNFTNSFTKFNIVYTGSVVLGSPNLRPVLDALGNLIDNGTIREEDASLDFYGNGNSSRLTDMFLGHRYAHLVKDFGSVQREKIIQIQRNAAILLIGSHPGMRGWVTSKLFEYIISGRPIIAFPRDQDCVDEMIFETNSGISCDEIGEVEAVLKSYYEEWKKTGFITYSGNYSAIKQYSTKEQTRKLAQILNEVVASGVHGN